jgi:hypothetical protein
MPLKDKAQSHAIQYLIVQKAWLPENSITDLLRLIRRAVIVMIGQERRQIAMSQKLDIYDPDLYVAGTPHEAFAALRQWHVVYWHERADGVPQTSISRRLAL